MEKTVKLTDYYCLQCTFQLNGLITVYSRYHSHNILIFNSNFKNILNDILFSIIKIHVNNHIKKYVFIFHKSNVSKHYEKSVPLTVTEFVCKSVLSKFLIKFRRHLLDIV